MADALDRAIAAKGSQEALAEAAGCAQSMIAYMKKIGRATDGLAIAISQASGVPCWQLRPDLYPPAMFKTEAAE